MTKFRLLAPSPAATLTAALLGLPLVGAVLAGNPITRYLEFPPLTHYVTHAPFSWPIFAILAALILAVVIPFDRQILRHRRASPIPRLTDSPAHRFPFWGFVGLALIAIAWFFAWTRFERFAPFQHFTFSPLWFGYIFVVNAWTHRRSGHCMLRNQSRYFLALFPVSAAFWWFFEYLNRFVQNWYYVGCETITPQQYFWFATLPFSTVLPAVLGTAELLATFPRSGAGLDAFWKLNLRHPRRWAWAWLVIAVIGLAGIGVWPDYLFPLLWIAPLILITAAQTLRGHPTLFAPLATGNWLRLYRLAAASLICGFFWEMWNYGSAAKWIYAVPFVNRFHLFEMPLLGYAGYLPFGLECAVIGDSVAARLNAAPRSDRPSPSRWVATVLALLLATVLWLPCLHLLFRPRLSDWIATSGLAPKAKALAAAQARDWEDNSQRHAGQARMRQANPEWDFMARTFHVLALANMALRDEAAREEYLRRMDAIIADTLQLEREQGAFYFMLDYARAGTFVSSPSRSIFLDGEIALMLGARRLVEEHADYQNPFRDRVAAMQACMERSPVLCGESYPNECWTFCNTIALAAMRLSDALDGTDHNAFFTRWLGTASEHLVDPGTGLLISSFMLDGQPLDGPEGSSIWMAAHCLQLIDREFAEDQYARAKRELARTVVGFGYAREWPKSWHGPVDVDSGPVIPILGISPASSGLAILGASAFDDAPYLQALLTSLNFGAFPTTHAGALTYSASNPVGDAVLLYAAVAGPLWQEVWKRCTPVD